MSITGPSAEVLAAFTSYNPDIELLERAVRSISEQVAEVAIVDNGSRNIELVKELVERTGSRLIAFPENRGIAAAFNAAFRYAKDKGFKWVLTCDQDSVMVDGMVARFLDVERVHGEHGRVGIVCPNFYNRTTGRLEYVDDEPRMIDSCISSGSLTLVSAWEAIGGFDEVMFIDGVDFEFCDRLKDSSFRVLLVPDVHMEHEIGAASLHGLPGHKFPVLNHSAFRKFYIAQNIIYRDGKVRGGRPSFVAHLKVLKQMMLVAFYEGEKREKIIQIVDGARAGRKLLEDLVVDK